MMEQKLNWMEKYDEVQDVARKTGKPILLFFHSHHCSGCKMMIEKTLPTRDVVLHAGHRFALGMFEISEPGNKDLVKKYNVEWTPTFIIADKDGSEAYRFVGYLPPKDFRAQLILGEGKVSMRNEDYDKAISCFETIDKKYPETEAAPEAAYYTGVAQYKKTNDAKMLKNAHIYLSRKYPESDWAKKAFAWSGL
ncbi:thioredoxin fold domain-containing protein [Methanocella arvoryzae]|nr:thioredoxin fold domain-containing protein [Methanocella arvoryzae]